MALRLLPIIVLLFAVLWLLRRVRPRSVRLDKTPARVTETLLRCRRCGLYITPDQAVVDDQGESYCRDHQDRQTGS